jgi:UrcA family protein
MTEMMIILSTWLTIFTEKIVMTMIREFIRLQADVSLTRKEYVFGLAARPCGLNVDELRAPAAPSISAANGVQAKHRANFAQEDQMNRHWKVKRGPAATVLAVFLGFSWAISPPAVAQQANEEMEEVAVIRAPIEHRYEGRTIRAPILVIELKQRVSYADLDLSERADVTTLETRIETIARESCEELSNMPPFGDRMEGRRCMKRAVHGTEGQVEAIMKAAG